MKGSELGNRCKGLGVIKMGLLGKSLSHQSSLVLMHRAISVRLNPIDPAAADSFPTSRQLTQFPDTMLPQSIVLLLRALLPESGIISLHHFFVRPGLSTTSQEGIFDEFSIRESPERISLFQSVTSASYIHYNPLSFSGQRPLSD